MQKLLRLFVFVLLAFMVTGCNSSEEKLNRFITVLANADGKIIIDTDDITSNVTFVNYEVDNIIIQFIVVRGTDGVVRIAFNTCQACNPSPNAYFVQVGEYLVCQNCGNKFHIDQIGVEQGGCNPAPVEEKEVMEHSIVLDQEYVESYKWKFDNWNGPIK